MASLSPGSRDVAKFEKQGKVIFTIKSPRSCTVMSRRHGAEWRWVWLRCGRNGRRWTVVESEQRILEVTAPCRIAAASGMEELCTQDCFPGTFISDSTQLVSS